MKVMPKKGVKKPSYPKLSDMENVCKTAAALTLTATTLLSVGACDEKTTKKHHKKSKKPVETVELAGDTTYSEPEDDFDSIDVGLGKVASVRPVSGRYVYIAPDETEITLEKGAGFVITGVNFNEIQPDSEFYKLFSIDDGFNIFSFDKEIFVMEPDAVYDVKYPNNIDIEGGLAEIDPDACVEPDETDDDYLVLDGDVAYIDEGEEV